ncbi:MAG: alcohol dehydrogenase catalytic domain-containing protein, partial [Phycisphaerales bacterium]|nr:alcohol dehydrogenase catalytic domain-containing protein [Phycisphaerales bacterium]
MKAALLTQPRRIEIQDVPDPKPGPRDVVVRNDAVGVCGSDVHIYLGHANWHLDEQGHPIPLDRHPQILGHEIAGTVVEIGSEVSGLDVGDRVIVDQGLNCASQGRPERCEYCATGYSHHCEHYREHGITGLPGGFAELIGIPAVNAVPIRGDLDAAEAVMTEPLGCVLHSLDLMEALGTRYRINAENPRDRVRSIAVCGGGPAGQLFVQAIRNIMGFEGRLFLTDPDPNKLKASAEADVIPLLADGKESIPRAIADETDGRLCELVIDACGAPSMWQDFSRLLRKQATAILYGFGRERGAAGS